MNHKKWYVIGIIALTLLTLALRLSISFQTSTPSYDSYFAVLEVNSIRDTGLPLYQDSLTGHNYVFSPIYYYLLALFSFIMPVSWVMKILPNIFIALIIPLIYLITFNLSKNRHVSFAASFFGAFAPALFSTYLNDASSNSLAILLISLIIYFLTSTKDKHELVIITTVFLVTISPLAWIIILTYLVQMLVLKLEDQKIDKKNIDLLLFSSLLLFWYTLIIYKEAIFSQGTTLIWKSISPNLLGAYFSELTYLSLIYAVGVVPIFLGLIAVYNNLFEYRYKKVFLIISLALATIIATIFKLIPLSTSILLVSLSFVLLAANGLKNTYYYLRKTKFDYFTKGIIATIVILFLLTSFFPALITGITQKVGPRAEELGAMYWLRDNTPKNSIILASPKEGFLIKSEAERSSLADNNYLLIENAEELLADINKVYTSRFKTAIVDVTDEYSVDYVYLGPGAHEDYAKFGVLVDYDECFKKVFDNKIAKIYEVRCSVKG